MSDDEFMMEGEEDYDLDYEDDDDEEEDGGAVDVENKYYGAKTYREDEPDRAITDWESIVSGEEESKERTEWGFKALKQLTKLTFKRGEYDRALGYYEKLLAYTKKDVTRNYAEKSINRILDYVSAAENLSTDTMQKFYDLTMRSLQESKNERLSQKTSLKLAKLWLDRNDFPSLKKSLKELHSSISASQAAAATTVEADGDTYMGPQSDAQGSLLMEVYAIEIAMYGKEKNSNKVKEIYNKTLLIKSAIPHPRIMGVIRETGGKMHMGEKEWGNAQVDFFEAFKNYDEAGLSQRIQCLKYLVLAHMLVDSEIDPFEAPDTKPYKNDPEIVAMTELIDAQRRRDIHAAMKIINTNKATILNDDFISSHIADVLRNLRTQWILDVIKPYKRIQTEYLARELDVSADEVESILVSLILDNKINGSIDQVTGRLELNKQKLLDKHRYEALSSWSRRNTNIHSALLQKVNQAGPHSAAGAGGVMVPGGDFMGGGPSRSGSMYGDEW